MVFIFFDAVLTLSVPEKLKNSVFEMPVIPQNVNIKLENHKAKSINLNIIRKLIKYSLKNNVIEQCLLLPFSKYCSWNVGQYYHPPSGAQGAKGLKFQRKTKKTFGFC